MIASYLKTGKRVITRHRVFSIINIIGLAASMSVGLLFITILADILRYDQFHEKKDRIVRVTTHTKTSHDDVQLATSPYVLAGEIKEQVPEVEQATTLGQFSNEFRVGDKVQALEGHWAQSSFFEVFSFQLISGDPSKALSDPNSVVITSSAATRMFGTTDVLGKTMTLNNPQEGKNPEFVITGVMNDVTKLSQMKFEALVSFATIDANNDDLNDWGNIWSNYTYVLLREGADTDHLQSSLEKISTTQNTKRGDSNESISFNLQPFTSVVFFGDRLDNEIGPTMPPRFLWLISGLSIVILITACFNYTNLSVARASARMREVGIRKVIGARAKQVMAQFMVESTVIALMALALAFAIFLLIRPQFLSLTPNLGRLLDLTLTPTHVLLFILFAILTGLISGFVPGMFFSKISSASALRGTGLTKTSSRMGMRKVLIVVQYVFALVFITSTVILYKQYQDRVNFDLGFNTNNIVNINLQGNDADVLESKLAQLPEVKATSRALMITSTGSNFYTYVKGSTPNDSIRSWYNKIDEKYLQLFDFRIIAGRNISGRLPETPEREAVVNQALIKQLNIASGDPAKAVGQVVFIENKELTIVGVVEDFHYSTLDRPIGPFVFRQLDNSRILNVKIESNDLPATMAKLETTWKTIDDTHTMNAQLYDHQIENAYREYSSIGKLVGFLSFLTVIICSLGLLGMVVFAAETRMKEMSVRLVLGATTWNVTYLLGRNFLLMLVTSMVIAIPVTWFFFTNVVLVNVAYHNPVGLTELFSGSTGVAIIALVVMISQGLRVSRTNPAKVLRSE